jgi:hypothetical protein
MSMDIILVDEKYIPNQIDKQKTIGSLDRHENTKKFIKVL